MRIPPPQADAESPSARIFLLALISLPVMPDATLWADPFMHVKG
jgi:hypothetical protein